MSRFTCASSGEKAASSSKPSVRGASTRAAAAAGTAARNGEAATAPAGASASLGDTEQPGAIELLEVDPAQLDRPEGPVGAGAPDPEDLDALGARLLRSDQEAKAAATADETAVDPVPSGQPGPMSPAEQPDEPEDDTGARGGKLGRRPAGKRRVAAAAAAGRRVTRARAGAAASPSVAPDVGKEPKAESTQAGGLRRGSAAELDGAATEGAARPTESTPVASSDCVLLDEAPDHSPGQHGDAESTPPQQSNTLPGTILRGDLQHNAFGSADAEASREGGDAAACDSPAASDSEHSSAMTVTPHLRAGQDVDSSPLENPAATRGGSVGSQAAEPDHAAVRQV